MPAYNIADVNCVTGEVTERAATDEEIADEDANIEQYETVDGFHHLRSHRNHLLKMCDWTANTSDSPLSEEKTTAWLTYRQELRDYPDQAARISDLPDWPTPPDSYTPPE